jgi:hypothetical protein
MTIVAPATPDPYAAHPMCMHKDRQFYPAEVQSRVPPFVIYAGRAPTEADTELQFSGEVYQEIQWEGVDDSGRQIAELAIVKFHMQAKHPVFGEIDISLDATRPGNIARLNAVTPGQKFPVIHTTQLHVVATVSTQPGMVLQSAGPALTFKSEPLSEWPPKENIYRLATKVDFEPRFNKGVVVMSSTPGGAIVGRP